jgi:hypothetical protein
MNSYEIKVVGADRVSDYTVISETFMIHDGVIQFINYTDVTKHAYDTKAIFPVSKTIVTSVIKLEK